MISASFHYAIGAWRSWPKAPKGHNSLLMCDESTQIIKHTENASNVTEIYFLDFLDMFLRSLQPLLG